MLKTLTLSALVAFGAATLTGVSAQPAAADGYHAGVVIHGGHVHGRVYHRDRDRRRVWNGRHGPRGRFLKRVRQGRVVCFAKFPRRGAYRWDHRPYRYGRAHGRRLGYRAVRHLVRTGRGHAMRCFSR